MKKLFIVLLAAVSFCSSCRFVTGQRIRGNGNVRTETRSPGSFKSVSSHGSFDVFVSNGEQSVKIEAEENLLPYIETYVEGNTLHVQTKDDYWLSPGRKVKIYVSSPNYESIRSFGSGDIIGESKITNSSKLELEVNGSANIKMDVDAPEINTETNGSGDMFLKGETKSFEGQIHGSGNIKAMHLRSNETKIEIYGSGNADVFVDGKLDVHVAGSGDVNYGGNAQVSSSMAGSGRVKKVD
jgi:hypothetical protein